MDTDRAMSRIFAIMALVLGLLAAIASLLLRTWVPLVAVGVVMFCVIGLTFSESATFAPLLTLVTKAGEKKPTRSKPDANRDLKPK